MLVVVVVVKSGAGCCVCRGGVCVRARRALGAGERGGGGGVGRCGCAGEICKAKNVLFDAMTRLMWATCASSGALGLSIARTPRPLDLFSSSRLRRRRRRPLSVSRALTKQNPPPHPARPPHRNPAPLENDRKRRPGPLQLDRPQKTTLAEASPCAFLNNPKCAWSEASARSDRKRRQHDGPPSWWWQAAGCDIARA